MNDRFKNYIVHITLGICLFLVAFLLPSKVYAVTVGEIKNFSYSNSIQEYKIPATGYYQLEVWGAQGGTAYSGYTGGYGGYSTGVVYLKKDQIVYIGVGGQGIATGGGKNVTVAGGYNGGGGAKNYGSDTSRYTASGGGATHISINNNRGVLSNYNSYRSEVLIVAGGGAGTAYYSSTYRSTTVGHAGGYIGVQGVGLQNGAKRYAGGGTQTGPGSNYQIIAGFGYGATSTGSAPGGGGGWYGGNVYSWAAGGGSGYIGNSLLLSRNGVVKSMYCYGCSTSTSSSTKTVLTSSVSGNAVAGYAKSEKGYARITLKELVNTNSKLNNISVSNGTFVQNFDPNTYIYDVVVDSENYNVNIEATPQEASTTVTGPGNYTINAGTNKITLTSTAASGDVSIYTLNIFRVASDYKYLADIKIDSKSIPNFAPEKLEYDIEVDYDTESINLQAIYGRPTQIINVPSDYSLKTGNNVFKIEVISEDGFSSSIYKVNIFRKHSSKLKSIDLGDYSIDFDSDTLTYTLNIMKSTMSIPIVATPYDEEAKVSLSGFGYIKASTIGTIIVTEPNSSPTEYKINIIKDGSGEEQIYNFPYNGGIQEFVAPTTGYYRLETWGAQGGTARSGYIGGYGGYSTGVVYLKKDQIVYIGVGGKGIATGSGKNVTVVGGYNGGGGAKNYASESGRYTASGGGATHISINNNRGVLSNYNSYRSDVLIVAGGGAGTAYFNSSYRSTIVGQAGGYIGVQGVGLQNGAKRYASGGTQTGPGANYTIIAGFGYGATSNGSAPGGGGGWYGGNVYSWAAGGGSGYIGHSLLRSYKSTTKVMYCYSCSTTLADATYTVSTKNVSNQPVSYYAKGGDGYARITLLAQASPNNFLTTITTDKGTLDPEFDMLENDYHIQLSPDEDTIKLDAILEDDAATLKGVGEFDVPAGQTTFPITATAENGDIRIYNVVVERNASPNSYPNRITIDGLIPNLCSLKDEYCKLDYEFNPDTASYHMTVPSRIKKLNFIVEKGHKYQVVTGDGEVFLKTGMNEIVITVTSEDKEHVSTYTYYIDRDMSGDNTIEELEVVDPATDIGFDPDTTEYFFSIPNNYTKLGLKVVLEDSKATYEVIGNENFESGLNIVEIVVTAQNGDKKTYTLNVYREQSGNTFLSKLEVSNDTEIFDLNPVFNKILSSYTVSVPNEVDQVEIIATPEHPLTVVTGAGVKNLKIGTNIFPITSMSEDGSLQIYQVAIIRLKNSDATLKTLDVLEGILSPDFQSNNFEYSVEVNPGVTSLNLNVEPTVSTSKYAITGNYGFKVGVDNVVSIVVTAEDGTKNTYKIHVNRKPSANNYLSYLNTDKYDVISVFDKETEEYDITVENEVSSIKVEATPEDSLSTVDGGGTYNLQVGNNDIYVTVTAEDGLTRTYILHIFRKSNSNTNLSSLTTDLDQILNPVFDKDVLDYTLVVGSEVSEIAIVGIPEVSTSKVIGNGVYNLHSGINLFKIVVEAEDKSTKEYTLSVTKEKSSNANLSMIVAKESVLDPDFDKNQTDYILKVIENVTSLSLLITPEDSRSTYEVIGNEDFVIGHNTVTIKVTAEDGTQKEYHLDVLRQEAGTTSNRLEWLKIDQGTLEPVFDSDTNYYEVEVPYNIDSVTLTGELEDKNATVTGLSTYRLEVGLNVLGVTVTSVENIVRYYQVVVTRKKNDEARLASLQILGSSLSPNFDKDVYQYSLSTMLTSLNITAIPLDDKATVQVIGNSDLQLGSNQVVVRVTAHDGVTTKDYVLNIEKEKSKNNNLESLEVVGKNFTPEFSKTTTVYYLDVDNSTETIQVNAIAEDINATIDGDGLVDLVVGTNYVQITVTSESGAKKMYTIIVTRDANHNNYLSSLEVSSGELSPDFLKTVNDYTVTVPYEVEEITLSGLAENSNATVVGLDKYSLAVGENKLSVIVTGEDGVTNTYTVTVIREKIVSSKLKELSVKNYQLNQTFNQDVYDYNVVVDSEVTALDLTAIPLDLDATYKIVGNENFIVGMNKVEIIVTDSLGKETSTYVLNVNRQNYANTYLAYIYPNKGSLSPNFNKTDLWYTVTVDGSVDTIDIMAEPEVSSNTLTGDGTYSLTSGLNKISLVVTTPSGISRTYYVNVIRNLNNNNDLLSLEVTANGQMQTLMPTFDKSTLNYTVNVLEDVSNINISATAEKSAVVTGTGNKILNVGENNFEILVTAEDGSVKKYQLKVNKKASSNNHLIDIVPSVGELNPAFSYTKEEYSLVLDTSASILSFDVVTEDIGAVVTGNEIQVVPDGLSKREIIVTAEDGSKRVYIINIYKEKVDEARLSSLTLAGYTFNEVFDKDIYSYTVTVPNSKKLILPSEVEAIPLDSSATVTKASSLVLYSTSTNIYTVVVTAKDGFTTQTYTIEITREKGNVSTLDKLEILGLPLTPVFISNVTEYTLYLPPGVRSFTNDDVVAVPTDYDATVNMPSFYEYSDTNNVYEIVVESPDKSSTTTYTINIEIVESSNALLSDLSVDHGILTPNFDKLHNSYTLELDSEIEELEISATAEDVNSVITGDGKQSVVTGLNRYEVVVTAEDGTVNTYVIEATREKSANTNILDIIPSSGSLSPSYSNEVDTYEVVVSEEIDTIDFEVQLESKRATVIGDKNNSLDYGENDITITVTAEDKTTKDVHIKVIREKKVTDIEVIEELVMEVGDIEVIDVKIVPEDATNKELTWEVADSSIVSVEDGVVTGLSLGDTEIKVSSKANEEVSKTIKVRVLNLKITSDIYDVRREETYPYIIGAGQGEKFAEFITKLNNEVEFIHFYNADSAEITDLENEQIKTGSYITIEYKDKVYDKVYIAVRGEINGDGEINVKDYNEAVSHTLKKKVLEDFWFVVANVDDESSGIINVKDSNMIQNKLLKKIPSLNP